MINGFLFNKLILTFKIKTAYIYTNLFKIVKLLTP